jgi:hypothetical protein
MLRVNWFMEKQDDSEWPSLVSHQLRQSNITEVAITNCVVWISPSQIEDIVFVFHSQLCVDQNFGPVFDRKSCYFTHTNIIFPPHEQNVTVSTSFISSEDYSPFGYDTYSTRPHHTIYTKRMAESILGFTRAFTKLLVRSGQVLGKQTETLNVSVKSWYFLSKRLGDNIDLEYKTTMPKTKQNITHANLSLQSKKLITCKETINARSPEGYDAFRELFSSSPGIGVRKRHPPTKTVGNVNLNLSHLQETDTVHMCDVDPSYLMDDLNAPINFIQLQYDHRLCECKLIVKCYAFMANSRNSAVYDELRQRQGLPSLMNVESDLRVGLHLRLDVLSWVILQIDRANGSVLTPIHSLPYH